VCTSTSGAGNDDAIIASQKALPIFIEQVSRARKHRRDGRELGNYSSAQTVINEDCKKIEDSKKDDLVRIIE
jgi:hypothetical protein